MRPEPIASHERPAVHWTGWTSYDREQHLHHLGVDFYDHHPAGDVDIEPDYDALVYLHLDYDVPHDDYDRKHDERRYRLHHHRQRAGSPD